MGHDYIHHHVHLNTSSVVAVPVDGEFAARRKPRQPVGDYPGGNPFPYVFNPNNPPFPVYSSFLPLPADLKPTAQYPWDVGIQRQITPRWFASATYLGTKIVNQLERARSRTRRSTRVRAVHAV